MLVRLSLLTFREGSTDADRRALADAVRRMNALATPNAGALVGENLPPNRNGGDILWRLEFASAAEAAALLESPEWLEAEAALRDSPALGALEEVACEPIAIGERGTDKPGGLYRVVIFAMDARTPEAERDHFDAAMAAMPNYVSTILRWNLARVVDSSGTRPWTHMWEQEFEDMGGFRGEYMAHPYHWGYLDCWFNSDNPIRMVDTFISNSFCEIDRPVMFARAQRPEARPFGASAGRS